MGNANFGSGIISLFHYDLGNIPPEFKGSFEKHVTRNPYIPKKQDGSLPDFFRVDTGVDYFVVTFYGAIK